MSYVKYGHHFCLAKAHYLVCFDSNIYMYFGYHVGILP